MIHDRAASSETPTKDIETVSIISSGHSGSTLIDMILGSHPEGFSLGEISHFDRYVRSNERCTCGAPIRECTVWGTVLDQLQAPFEGGEYRTDVRRLPGDRLPDNFRHILSIMGFAVLPYAWAGRAGRRVAPGPFRTARNIHRLYDLIREVTHAGFVVDSSKSVYRFRLLHEFQPTTTRAIYLTRDGRGVMSSFMKQGGKTAGVAARRWARGQRYTSRLLDKLDPSTYCHIHYEGLCREPTATIRKICDFLGLSPEPDMLSFRSTEHHNVGGNRFRFSGARTIKESVTWREYLDEAALDTFEQVAGDLNRRLLGRFHTP